MDALEAKLAAIQGKLGAKGLKPSTEGKGKGKTTTTTTTTKLKTKAKILQNRSPFEDDKAAVDEHGRRNLVVVEAAHRSRQERESRRRDDADHRVHLGHLVDLRPEDGGA